MVVLFVDIIAFLGLALVKNVQGFRKRAR